MLLSVFAVPVLALSAVSACDSTFPPVNSTTTVNSTSPGHTTSPLIPTSPKNSTTPGNTTNSTSLVKAAWYAGFHATEGFPLSSISWDKYNTLFYSFAVPTENTDVVDVDDVVDLLPQFVSQARAHGVKAHVALGGWAGSQYFSSDVATADNRTQFATTVLQFADDYNLDGLQFDWEYPNRQGVGCNIVSASDTENFLAFLQELRKQPLCSNLTLSAAVTVNTFVDVNGNFTADVSEFAKVLDYVAVMDYDIWGGWSPTVGPNAPLNDTCAPRKNQHGSAVSAVNTWTAAGMPADQIVLGVASYGHSYRVSINDAFMAGTNVLATNPPFDAQNPPLGDSWDNVGGTDVCGVYQPSGGTYRLWGLVESGFLLNDTRPRDGIIYNYDNCSQTAYVYNTTSEVMVSYDDAPAFAAKGKFIADAGLRGFAMWEAGGDQNDILLDSITGALGK